MALGSLIMILGCRAPVSANAEYLIVAGGGGGGHGGGGGGGVLEGSIEMNEYVSYPIIIGAGGTAESGYSIFATQGNASRAFDIEPIGGGAGGSTSASGFGSTGDGYNGASGGGGGKKFGVHPPTYSYPTYSDGGKGVYPGSTYIDAARQGYDGGRGYHEYEEDQYPPYEALSAPTFPGGGGGGGGQGGDGDDVTNTSGTGGIGYESVISGTSTRYAGGGGGGGGSDQYYGTVTRYAGASGGLGGGGAGGSADSGNYQDWTYGESGEVNSGGGGGGGHFYQSFNQYGGNGGSGIVIIKIPDSRSLIFSEGVTYSQTSVEGSKIYTITETSTAEETMELR